MLCYRNEYRVERIFNRLKSRVHIAPLFVKRNDQIEGLTYLLTLGVRVLTVMEFVLRRALQTDQTKLPGLHPERKTKMTDQPTAERILKAFADITLTIIRLRPEKIFYVGLHPYRGYRKTSCNGWDWGLLSTYSLKFRQWEPDAANGELYHSKTHCFSDAGIASLGDGGTERWASGAAGSGSEERADAGGRRFPGRASGYPTGPPTDPYVRN